MINAVSYKNCSQLTLFKIIISNNVIEYREGFHAYGIYVNIIRHIKGIICLI